MFFPSSPWEKGVPTEPLTGIFLLAEQDSFPHPLYQRGYPDNVPQALGLEMWLEIILFL